MSDIRVEHANTSSRIGMAIVSPSRSLRSPPRRGGRTAPSLRLLSEIYAYVALASLWNLLAGYAGLVSVGQQAYVGLGAYVLFGLAMLAGVHPLAAIPLAGIAAAIVAVPVAALIFRLRGHYFAIGTWVVAEVFRLLASQVAALGGGSGTSLPIRGGAVDRRDPPDARVHHLLDRARAGRRHPRRHRLAAALALWPRAHRDPRQRARRALERRRCRAHQIRGLCRGGVRHRDGRRADLSAEDPHLPGHGVFGERLDRLRHLHHRDRRHRPDRRARSSARWCSSCCARRSPTSARSIC